MVQGVRHIDQQQRLAGHNEAPRDVRSEDGARLTGGVTEGLKGAVLWMSREEKKSVLGERPA